jgi:uncharacterized protein YndB with AHSA1/START domain
VTAFEPPERVVLAWQLDERWQYDPDPSHASEVEVRFIAEGPSQTRVGPEHRGFERHGAGRGRATTHAVARRLGWANLVERVDNGRRVVAHFRPVQYPTKVCLEPNSAMMRR